MDLDRDGRVDLVCVGPRHCAVYRNLGGWKFRNVTDQWKPPQDGEWGGCTVGDYNNDGYPDLLLTGYRRLCLLQNERGRRFGDRSDAAALRFDGWSTSAAFVDLNADGWLDLYVGAYVAYRRGTDDLCPRGSLMTACGPEVYAPQRGRLFINRKGVFQDLTEVSGLHRAAGKTWGVAPADFNDDGRPDLYMANDRVAGNLFENLGGLRFRDVGVASGTAFDARGNTQGGMGVDWGDADGDGLLDLFVSTFSYEAKELYRNQGCGQFQPRARAIGLAEPTLPYVAFGCGFLDADNDGDLDLFIANGHVRDNADEFDSSESYAQPLQLLLNDGSGRYSDGTSASGMVGHRVVGRGCAFADLDQDGWTDILVIDLEGRAQLWRNLRRPKANRWLKVRLRDPYRNQEGLGAKLELRVGLRRQRRIITRARGLLSASDAEASFGLGEAGEGTLAVTWPDGKRQDPLRVQAGQSVVVTRQ